jgi:hypothetical protein
MKTLAAMPKPKFKAAPKLPKTPNVMYVYGIDPGKSGAIVLIDSKTKLKEVDKMPLDDHELGQHLDMIVDNKSRSEVWVERIPKFAGKNQSGASVATLFANYRYIVGYLEGRGVTVHQVVPQVWMKRYRLQAPGWQMMTYNDRKKFLHGMALAEFFASNKTLPRWAADAALIALHGATVDNILVP